ncbi:hypothetical protein Tco_0927910 [Tanacetum coccineum]
MVLSAHLQCQMRRSKPEEKCLLINRNLVINCVALRVLELWHVTISADVFEKLLSTCILLEKVDLLDCKGLKNIKLQCLLSKEPSHLESGLLGWFGHG